MNSNANKLFHPHSLLVLLVAALFLIFPYWSAMFFRNHIAYSGLYIGLVFVGFAVWGLVRKTEVKGLRLIDGLALVYSLVVLLTIFTASQQEFTITGMFKQFGYLLLYGILRVAFSAGVSKRAFLYVIAGSGALFSLFGLLIAFHVFNYSGGLSVDETQVRIASVFQYSNSLASYLAVSLLIGFSLQSQMERRWTRAFWMFANTLSLLVLVLTYSRGGWIFFALSYLALLFLAPKQQRPSLFVHSAAVMVLFAVSLPFVGASVAAGTVVKGLTGLGIALAGSIALTFLLSGLIVRASGVQVKWKLVVPILFVFLVVAGFVAVNIGVVPQTVVDRIASIDLQSFSVQQRIVFYQDGLSALKDHPIIGSGDHTWEATFYKYQSYPYYTTAPHSLLIDQLMDTGLVGALLFFTIIVMTIVSFWKVRRSEGDAQEALLTAALLAGFLELILHAMIDVDFNYALIGYLFWMLVAMGASRTPLSVQGVTDLNAWKWAPTNRWLIWSFGVFGLLVALYNTSYAYAGYQMEQAKKVLGEPPLALQHLDKAESVAPYIMDLTSLAVSVEDRYYQRTQDPIVLAEIQNRLEKMPNRAPNSADVLGRTAQELFSHQKYLPAVELIKRAWEVGPYRSELAQQYMNFATQIGEALVQDQKDRAKGYFQQTVQTYKEVGQRIEGFKNLPSVLYLERKYEYTPDMLENTAISAFYLGDYALAEQAVSQGMQLPGTNSAKFNAVLAALQQKQGKQDEKLKAAIQKDLAVVALYQKLISYQP